MQPEEERARSCTKQRDINRAAPANLDDYKESVPNPAIKYIANLENELAETKLELRAYREAMRNAKAIDEIHWVKWQLAAIVLLNDQEFIDHLKNMVQVNDRRSTLKG